MTLADLLTRLRELDVRLRLDGEHLRFDAPEGAVGEELRAVLRQRKPELVAWLRDSAASAGGGTIPRVPRDGVIPASFAQRRMWFLHHLAPDAPVYTMSGALRLRGCLDVGALERSLEAIQSRHEVLRTTFPLVNGEPVQEIRAGAATPLSIEDLSALGESVRAQALDTLTRDWSRRPFDLQRGPLFRAQLVRLDPDDHVLLLSFHHIVCDGWSIGVFVREMAACYAAEIQGRPAALPDLPVQYADFAVWQPAALDGPAFDAHVDYWRRTLASAPVLDLPADRPRRSPSSFAGALHAFSVPDETSARLETLARRHDATLFMVLFAAFAVLLHRWTGQEDLIVGSAVANRQRPELEPLIGFFVNSLALRAAVTPAMTVRELLRRVREVCLDAYEHQDVPIETLVEELRPSRDGARNPLYQVMFGLQSAPARRFELPGLTIAPLEMEAVTSRVDLTLSMSASGGRLRGIFEYSTELFEAATVERLAAYYGRVLEGLVAAGPSAAVSELPLMPEAQRAVIVARGTGTRSRYPRGATLGALFQAAAERHAEAIAIEEGPARWTYRECSSRVNQLAGALRARGVAPNVPVGVWLERGAPLVSTLVGITCAGAAYVPLDPKQPAGRAADILRDVGAPVVVTTRALAPTLPEGPWAIVTLDDVDDASRTPVAPAGTADDLAYVIYTSGSTGRPKGVAVPHRAVARLVCDTDYVALGPQTVMAQAATAAFDAATFEIWGALLHGGRLVIVPTDVALSPSALAAYLQRTGVTTLFLTTALVHQIGRERPAALNGVDDVLFGGEAVEPRWIAAIMAAGGPRRLLHVYGPTETTTFASWFPVGIVPADASTIPIGGPIAETDLYVLDGGGEPAALGMPGELYIGGDGLARGYVGAPRLTAERFVPDGVSGAPGARLYRSGDIVRWREPGVVEFLGRRDGQVKIRGNRIEIGEVEATLAGVPGVGGAIVTVRGEGVERQLAGYVTPAPGATLTAASVREALKTRAPAYMVPATICVLPAFPLNANGKVDRAALPEPHETRSTPESVELPRGAIEERIAAVWRDVLGLAAVGVQDNFFDLGGHSLLLVRVQAGLEAAFGRHVPLVTLFQFPTIAGLAAHFSDDASTVPAADATPGPSAGAIAIVGLAGRFPGAPDLDTFWANLRAGRETIRRFTPAELEAAGIPGAVIQDARYVPARGALEDVDLFDAPLFGFTPKEAALIDPQQRLLLECAWEALEHAGYGAGTRHAGRVGVFAGTSPNTYLAAASRQAIADAGALQVLISSDKDFLATRLSYKLQLTGPSITVQTACSTSLVAVHAACQALRAGECDMALAGGVSVTVPSVGGYLYQPEGIASPDGHCRAFDARAAGTVPGNGAGLVVLKRLEEALADGDDISAVIRGSAVNNDGADKVGFTAPSVHGQAAAIAAAQAAAGIAPETITYIEAHGTGTSLGDPIEVAALRQVFGDGAGPGSCALGSVKSNIGHLDAAAGVAGLIKAVLAMRRAEIPPSVHFESANAALDLGPFHVPTRPQPWVARPGVPRRAGVSSFGIGGTNAHVIIEEPPARRESDSGRPWQIVPVSGASEAGAAAAAARLADWLDAHPDVPLADVAYTQQMGRSALAVRRVAVGQDAASIAAHLRESESCVAGSGTRPLVWLFPGQGTHATGLGRALYETEAVFRAELDACAAAVDGLLDGDLRAALYPSPAEAAWAAERLAGTTWAQVTLVAVELALASLWRSWGVQPAAVAGHSVGELAAACVAGVLTREDALSLVVTRGRLMQDAADGGMLAVAAPAADVSADLGPDLWLAAVNSPTQCVIAGSSDALTRLEARWTAGGRTVQRLPVAGAFHSGLMSHVVEPLSEYAKALALKAPQVAWMSSVTGKLMSGAEATDPAYWGRQVVAPVQWAAAIDAARRHGGAPLWLEIGPGRTLINLTRGAAAEAERAVATLDGPEAARSVARAVAELWASGVAIDWAAYHSGTRRCRVALPTYPFQRQRYWLEAGRGDDRGASPLERSGASWFYRPLWKQALPLVPRRDGAAPARRWLLLADDAGLAEELAIRLRAGDERVVLVEAGDRFAARGDDRYTVRIREGADYDALVRRLDDAGFRPSDIVHMWSLSAMPSGAESHEALAPAYERCFHSLLHLTRAVSRRAIADPLRLAVVTNQAYAITGDEELQPIGALAGGPCRVIPAEFPNVTGATIDLAWPDTSRRGRGGLVDRLAGELRLNDESGIVALRGAHRWIQAVERVEMPEADAAATRLRERGVYLITGGLGGVGSAIATVLAQRVRARLVLVGRTEMPPRSAWEQYARAHADDPIARRIGRVEAIEASGAEVMLASADVTSFDQMRAVIRQVRDRFGRIDGVIHAAGLPGDGTIARKSRQAAAAVLSPKIDGTLVLARLLDAEPLDFVVLCSSLASLLGGLGQVDYCAANAFLDAYAQACWCRGDLRWRSINWDTWQHAGMAVETPVPRELLPIRERALRSGLTEAEGAEMFLRALGGEAPQIAVCTKDFSQLAAATAAPPAGASVREAIGGDTPSPRHPRPHLASSYAAPGTETARRICAAFERALGVSGVGVNDSFFELGGHSLIAIDLMSQLNRQFGTNVPVAGLYEGLTPGFLAGLFDAPPDAPAPARETKAASRRTGAGRRQAAAARRRDSRLERRQRP